MESLIRKKTSLLILRKDLKIIDVNTLACDFLGMSFEELSGTDLKDVLPELLPLCNKAFELGYIHDEPLIIPRAGKKNNDFYVDCISVKQNDTLLGMAIYLTSAKYVSRYISDVTGSTARFSFDDLIGRNPSFRDLKYAAMKVAPNNSNIFISGESGTGKELLAQAIHSASSRSKGPFVAINCSAIPKELISSELFGYESGAFTGARPGGAMGKFEQANKGTLFLDEIGEMSFDVQAALLRVLDEGAVTRLGSSRPRKVDVRIIAATNRDLYQSVREGSFRLDLFYRINVIRLNTIPLHSRADDIPLLTEYYISKLNDTFNKEIKGLDDEAMQCL